MTEPPITWRRGLEWPKNIIPFALPAYCPELNSIERLWLYWRTHHLSNQSHRDYRALMDALQVAHDATTPAIVKSVCRTNWLRPIS